MSEPATSQGSGHPVGLDTRPDHPSDAPMVAVGPDEIRFEYSGKDNLETMGVAVNYNRHLAGLVEREIVRGRSGRTLDFGAGTGTITDLLAADGFRVECLEPDEEQRGRLRAKGYDTLTDLGALPPASFDLIYTLNVLEHIADDADAVAQLAAALRSGGKLLVYVPAFQFLFSSRDRKVGHHRRYRRRQVGRLARRAGLRIERLEYCDPVGFFAAIAYRLGDHGDGRLSEARVRFFDRYLFPLSPVLQPLFRWVVGKNVLLVATKP